MKNKQTAKKTRSDETYAPNVDEKKRIRAAVKKEGIAPVLDQVRNYWRRRLVVPKGALTVMVLWAAWTYHHNRFSSSPRLAFTAATLRSGKTTALELIDVMAHNSKMASSVTPSSIFRYIHSREPTMLFDESQHWIRDGDIKAILNSGFRKSSATVMRADRESATKVNEYSTWAPVAYAMNGEPYSELADRSIIIHMSRAEPEIDPDYEQAKKDLIPSRIAVESWTPKELNPDPKLPKQLKGRAKELWRPLFSIAEAVGPQWVRDLRQAVDHLEGLRNSQSLHEVALRHCYVVFQETGLDKIIPHAMAKGIVERFPDVWDTGEQNKLTPAKLARHLKSFVKEGGCKLTPRPARLTEDEQEKIDPKPTGANRRAYHKQDFRKAWEDHSSLEDLETLFKEEM